MAVIAPDGSLVLTLPYPPSVNHYWLNSVGRSKRGKPCVHTRISERGRRYTQAVEALTAGVEPIDGEVSVTLLVWMPDRKKRDLDNLLKCVLDSLTKAGVWGDDSQVDELRIVRKGITSPYGKVIVRIKQLEAMLF